MKRGLLRPGAAPKAAGVIVGGVDRRTIQRAAKAGADLLELRVDTFGETSPERLAAAVSALKKDKALGGLPLLVTVRHRAEGGEKSLSDARRAEIYGALIPYADMMDTELRSAVRLRETIRMARKAGVGVILSYHNFKATPGAARLKDIIRRARAEGADAVKIAACARSRKDLRRLAGLLAENDDLIVIAMGEEGRASRVFFPLLGSLITYGSVTGSSAPGQMSLRTLKKELAGYGV